MYKILFLHLCHPYYLWTNKLSILVVWYIILVILDIYPVIKLIFIFLEEFLKVFTSMPIKIVTSKHKASTEIFSRRIYSSWGCSTFISSTVIPPSITFPCYFYYSKKPPYRISSLKNIPLMINSTHWLRSRTNIVIWVKHSQISPTAK